MGMQRVVHVVLKVRDLEEAKGFYVGVLGMKVGNYDPKRGMFLRFGDYHHDIAIFKTPGPCRLDYRPCGERAGILRSL